MRPGFRSVQVSLRAIARPAARAGGVALPARLGVPFVWAWRQLDVFAVKDPEAAQGAADARDACWRVSAGGQERADVNV